MNRIPATETAPVTGLPYKLVTLDLSASTEIGRQVRYFLNAEKIKWPEGVDTAKFVKRTIPLVDITYGKNEILIRTRNPHDSFFTRTRTGKYWTILSLQGKSLTDGPIILDWNLRTIDGHHRIIDAAWEEKDSIEAYVRIKTNSTKITTCARCHAKPRKNFRLLNIEVNVVVNYQTKERKTFYPNDALCVRCWHSSLPLYGGKSNSSNIEVHSSSESGLYYYNYTRTSDNTLVFQ